MASDQKRVFLWAVPRSLSCSFFRAMNNAVGTKGIFEPFCQAYQYGSERVSRRFSDEPPKEGRTFADIKGQLEESHPEAKAVFVKDMPYALLAGPRPLLELIPAGYTHTFLIRNPLKSLPSFYKVCNDKDKTGWDYFDPKEAGFNDMFKIYTAITQSLGQAAIILDADDILEHPEDMIRLYCDKTGLEYQRVMIHWDEALPEKMDIFKVWPEEWFSTMLANKTFNKAANKPMPDITTQPDAVQQAIRDSQPYYDKLYKLRLMPMGVKYGVIKILYCTQNYGKHI